KRGGIAPAPFVTIATSLLLTQSAEGAEERCVRFHALNLALTLRNRLAPQRTEASYGRGHIGQGRSTKRVVRSQQHVQLLRGHGHLPRSSGLDDRRAEAADAEAIDAAPVEEWRRALAHEFNLL